MPFPVVFLIHTCTPVIRRESGDTDQYGNPVFTETEMTVRKCRFTGAVANQGTSRYYSTARCLLQADTDIQENDRILTDTPGYAREYWVNAVRQVHEATSNTISHTILDLRETEEQEAA